ncbi:hydroxymethylglutaryl-CoA lyase [Pikeienuella piscinae]|uniref:Hydroxymethylglutaryl-CoA lyase n=1 Tax=Pikeienuella piscinae TaxID=2748098 RepID=A0A7L5BTP3_9RHOB|nr:hydroxymethylglutaryl-CoA lyase [Pikeienuella piscinae]QIE54451.1 hydroxymethylglutaryl-CoA lyase [Pikeienuella piscinae]
MKRVAEIYPSDRVTLREVGLRDGLQLVQDFPSTEAKIEWLRRETEAGVRHFELGSFLPVSRMPQFADLGDLIETTERLGLHSAALALNERGVENAVASVVAEIGCVVSATEEHSQANMRRSRADAIALVGRAAALAKATPRRPLVNAGLSMAFGCSIAGEVDPDEVLRLIDACIEAGADVVGVADTVGFTGPKQVGGLTARATKLCGETPLVVHLHDTRGMGVANAAAALDNGCRVLDGSLGGLGGCPFAPGASGNVVYEDLVFLAETMGFRTGVDLDALKAARAVAEGAMPGESFHGALAKAGPPLTEWRL